MRFTFSIAVWFCVAEKEGFRDVIEIGWKNSARDISIYHQSIQNHFPQSRRDSFIFKISKNPINKETHFGKNLNCPEGSKGVEWEKMVSGLKEYYFGPICIHYNLHVGEQAGMQFLPNTNQLDLLSTVVKISAIFFTFSVCQKVKYNDSSSLVRWEYVEPSFWYLTETLKD